ncbi:LysR substrate-binding domain-containing protein [Pseudomonas abieticivorans]|uniref:LysR substrate-binding domain-containing protein n=1 Tax=Pseudomonas abieticivorans TaxID=2931382 RepID=UPI0020BECFB7|nr:LysR substrate-binding domain-containing protein [Pseudomonas sp. PIA16]
MRHQSFDLDVLRTFVTGVQYNSFAQAAERLGRSTSAVSAQLKKLEDQVGSPVLERSGRGLALTPVGEALLSQARRLLELNDEIFSSLRETQVQGTVRLGLQEDFGEHLLSDLLQRFARLYPKVSLEVHIGRSRDLLAMIASDRVDLALAWDTGQHTPYAQTLSETAMQWIGKAHATPFPGDAPLPLVLFDAPCVLRSAATQALDGAGIAWRVAFTSPSVAGLWAAVNAGLGVTLRTRIGLPGHLAVLTGLPAVGVLGAVLHWGAEQPTPAVKVLGGLIADAF